MNLNSSSAPSQAKKVDWVLAARGHRGSLSNFTCSSPRKKVKFTRRAGVRHPCPWELEVQKFIRKIKPPVPPPRTCFLGVAQGKIVAVGVFRKCEPDLYVIDAVAIESSRKRSGYGELLVGELLTKIVVAAGGDGEELVRVECLIHKDNTPSIRLFDKTGFSRDPDGDEGELLSYLTTIAAERGELLL